MRDSIRDCFVTGKWKEDEDAEELLALDDLEEDSEGDFEDLETGQVHQAKSSEVRFYVLHLNICSEYLFDFLNVELNSVVYEKT